MTVARLLVHRRLFQIPEDPSLAASGVLAASVAGGDQTAGTAAGRRLAEQRPQLPDAASAAGQQSVTMLTGDWESGGWSAVDSRQKVREQSDGGPSH